MVGVVVEVGVEVEVEVGVGVGVEVVVGVGVGVGVVVVVGVVVEVGVEVGVGVGVGVVVGVGVGVLLMPSGGDRGGRRPELRDPRENYTVKLNTPERKMLIDLAQRLKIDSSKCIRRAIKHLDADQSILALDLEALQTIEDIRTVGEFASKGEAVSAAVKFCAKKYRLELLTEMVKADLPTPKGAGE